MSDLARGHTSNTSHAAPTPRGYAATTPTTAIAGNPGRGALEDDLAAAEAAQAAAARKVQIAELAREELGDDAKPSARAIADDRLDTAAAAYTAAEIRTHRARAALDAADGRDDEAPDGQADELAYPSADAWLRGWLLPNWRRPIEARWCPKWWLHAEAVSRLEAIWRAWEYLRGDGALGPSVWWRDHADYHLAILTAEYGTFARCNHRREHHQQVETLPAVPNPLNLDDFIAEPDVDGSRL